MGGSFRQWTGRTISLLPRGWQRLAEAWRAVDVESPLVGHRLRQSLLVASNASADLRQRLRCSKWPKPQWRRRHSPRDYKPPLDKQELQRLRSDLKIYRMRWARRSAADSVEDSKKVDPVASSLTKTELVRLENFSLKDLELPLLTQRAQEIRQQLLHDEHKEGVWNLTSRLLASHATIVGRVATAAASLLPQLPFMTSSLAGSTENSRPLEQQLKKKEMADGGGHLELSPQDVGSVGLVGSGDDGPSQPHGKRLLSHPLTLVSKSVVDARTHFCVNALRQVDVGGSRCLRRLETFCTHLHQYPYAKGVAVREHAINDLLRIRRATSNKSVLIQVREALRLLGYQDPLSGRGIRILSLDGGGMRGLCAIEVLRSIERMTGKHIYELFDFICGVSTGAIIAAFLACHKKSVREVEETYNQIGRDIFSQSVLRGTRGWVMSHSYYDTPKFERELRRLMGEMKMVDTLRSEGTPKTAIMSTLVSGHRIMPFVFRNYRYPYRSQSFYRGSSRYAIWEAVRASSAAPGYFDEFYLNGEIHHDGGILTNNATNIAIHEAQKLWPNDQIQCVVSLGMGRHERPITLDNVDGRGDKNPKALSLAQKFSRIIDAATDTEITHVGLHDLLSGHVYYRFNPFLSEYVPLDEVRPEKISAMRADTRMYLRRNHNRVIEVCNQLQLPRKVSDRVKDFVAYTKMLRHWSHDPRLVSGKLTLHVAQNTCIGLRACSSVALQSFRRSFMPLFPVLAFVVFVLALRSMD